MIYILLSRAQSWSSTGPLQATCISPRVSQMLCKACSQLFSSQEHQHKDIHWPPCTRSSHRYGEFISAEAGQCGGGRRWQEGRMQVVFWDWVNNLWGLLGLRAKWNQQWEQWLNPNLLSSSLKPYMGCSDLHQQIYWCRSEWHQREVVACHWIRRKIICPPSCIYFALYLKTPGITKLNMEPKLALEISVVIMSYSAMNLLTKSFALPQPI